MKLPISIEHASLRCDTSVLFDSATTLSFASRKSLNWNGFVGKCIRGPNLGVHNDNGQRLSATITLSPTMLYVSQKLFLGLGFWRSSVASQLRCVLLGFQKWKSWDHSVHLLIVWVIDNQLFYCESQPRRVSCILGDSSKIQIIWTKVASNKRT